MPLPESFRSGRVGPRMLGELRLAHRRVDAPRTEPVRLPFAGQRHTHGHLLGGLPVVVRQLRRGGLLDGERDVEAIRERPGEARGVRPHLIGAAPAPLRTRPVSAGARIRGRADLEPGGKRDRAVGPRDRHPALLQGLAQRLEARPRELPELVQEEDATVRERDLPGPRRRPATDEPGSGDGVVRSAERSRSERSVSRRASGDAGDLRHLDGLGRGKRWKQGRKASRRQRLAGTGRADDQQTVSSSRGDLERVAKRSLTTQIGEVRQPSVDDARPRKHRLRGEHALCQIPEICEATERRDPETADEPRLPEVGGRRGDPGRLPGLGAGGALGHGEDAAEPADAPVESELAGEPPSLQLRPFHLLGGAQDGRRDRKIEAWTRLAQVGGREAGGDPRQREVEAAVDDRRPHTLARLPHRSVRKTDEGEGR